MTLLSEILINEQLSAEEAADLVDDFTMLGLSADVRMVSHRRSLGDVTWFVLAALPVKPFFDRLAADFASHAYARLKAVVNKVLHRQAPGAGTPRPLVLQDTITGVQIVLEHDLPPESYQQLLRFDLSTVHRGPLHYDPPHHRWRSELDEAAQTPSPPDTSGPS